MNPKCASLFPSVIIAAMAALSSLHLLESSALAEPEHGLKGLVFEDDNKDGVKDDAEFGRGGVIVDLLDSAGKHVTRLLTQPDGTYLFGNLQPGVYFLRFEFSPGFAVRSQGIAVGSDGETVFTPVPVISPDSGYNFTRLNLMNPASFMGNEVSPFTP